MKKNAKYLTIKVIAAAVLLTVLTFTQLPVAGNSQNDYNESTFCFNGGDWENS